MKRIVKITALVLVLLLVASAAGILALWYNELASVASFKKIRARNDAHMDGAVYALNVKGGFYLEDFVAQGGVSDDSELISFVVDHITKGLIPVHIDNPEIGCSSFTAQTADGDALFARNYDMNKTNTCIVRTEGGNGRHATVSTADLGLLGMDADADVEGLIDKITCLAAVYAPLDGMNDAGVACGVYMTYQGPKGGVAATDQQTDRHDMTTTTFLRLVLDYADDLDEAVKIAKAYDMHDSAGTSYHYMVADASGRSAILEWVAATDAADTDGSARELVITYNDQDAQIGENEGSSDAQWVTNFVIQPGYYDSEEDQKGLDRYLHIEGQLMAAGGVLADERAAMDVLASVGRRSWNNDSGEHLTIHSAIYNLTDKTVVWLPNENYHDPEAWFTFAL